MSAFWLIPIFFAGAYVISVIEAWTLTGTLRLQVPLGGLGLPAQESILPRSPDRVFFESAPGLMLLAPVLAFAVLPVAPGSIVTNLATGVLFVNAALAFIMVALVMAGWGSHSAYSIIAGWRFLGQFVGYGMLIVMPIAAVAMRAESLATTEVVRSQANSWNIVTQPLGFAVFLPAAMALCFLPPFDLPLAPGELAGGVSAEYSGARLAVFRLGRLILILTLATSITVFYLGGWHGPLLPAQAWTALKTTAVAAVMLTAGQFMPRLREEQVLQWSWKFGIPIALLNIFIVGIELLVE